MFQIGGEAYIFHDIISTNSPLSLGMEYGKPRGCLFSKMGT